MLLGIAWEWIVVMSGLIVLVIAIKSVDRTDRIPRITDARKKMSRKNRRKLNGKS
jgi:hypothetical protein